MGNCKFYKRNDCKYNYDPHKKEAYKIDPGIENKMRLLEVEVGKLKLEIKDLKEVIKSKEEIIEKEIFDSKKIHEILDSKHLEIKNLKNETKKKDSELNVLFKANAKLM